jgi:chromosome segregation ATPase
MKYVIRDAFIRMVNKLSAERGPILADLREIQATYSGTDDLENTLRELDERLNREADAVQELIATNARVAQNQDEYSVRYDALVSGYEATKKERDRVAAEIRQKGIRRREFQRFIAALEKLPDEVTEFEEGMWSDLVESMTVYSKDDLRFTLPCKTEIKA